MAAGEGAPAPQPPEPVEVTAVSGATRVGRYRLCFELASGGMASVYLARAEGPAGFEKLVALKRIHPHLAREREFVEMFLDEARLASRIGHPNVCAVFDFGEAEGGNFIAMEFLLGENLSRVYKVLTAAEGPRDWGRVSRLAARIVADAAEGLHAAHELKADDGTPLNVVHRDVSPQNLFVTYDGVVKVVDFGIARAAGKLHHTATGAVKGKFAYMAPEQAKRIPVDRRADVWSLGVVLWELATGQRLFRQDTEVDTLVAVINEPIPPPSQVRPGIPAALDEVVLGALERDRDKRYPTAREFGRDLQRFLIKQGLSIGPPEVADWMRELFPEELARRQELIDQARRIGSGPVPRISSRLSGDGASPVLHGSIPEVPSQVLTRPLIRRKQSRSFVWVLSGIAMLVGILGVFSVRALQSDPADPPAERARRPAAVAAPEPPRLPSHEVAAPPVSPEPVAPALEVTREPGEAPSPSPRPRRPESTPAEQPRAGPPGTVNVAAVGGWADIFVGGQRRGRTPAQITLPPGRHMIELRPFGELPARRRPVVVPPGGTARVVVEL